MTDTTFKRMKDLPSIHLLGTGTPMCAGCGGLEALHEIYDVLGEKTVFVNAAGCMTLLAFRIIRFLLTNQTLPGRTVQSRAPLPMFLAMTLNARTLTGLTKILDSFVTLQRKCVHE